MFLAAKKEELTEEALKTVDSKKSQGWIGAFSKAGGQAWRDLPPAEQKSWNEKARIQTLEGLPLEQRRKYDSRASSSPDANMLC